MPRVFDLNRILGRLEQEDTELGRLSAQGGPEVDRLMESGRRLYTLRDMAALIDQGECHGPCDHGARPHMALGLCIHSYLMPSVVAVETALIPHPEPSCTNEPALFFRYQGEHGDAVCVHGLRNHTEGAYVARNDEDSDAATKLYSWIVRPVRVGFDYPIHFRGTPVYPRPETDWQELLARVAAHISPITRKRDGFLPANPSDYKTIYELATQAWF